MCQSSKENLGRSMKALRCVDGLVKILRMLQIIARFVASRPLFDWYKVDIGNILKVAGLILLCVPRDYSIHIAGSEYEEYMGLWRSVLAIFKRILSRI